MGAKLDSRPILAFVLSAILLFSVVSYGGSLNFTPVAIAQVDDNKILLDTEQIERTIPGVNKNFASQNQQITQQEEINISELINDFEEIISLLNSYSSVIDESLVIDVVLASLLDLKSKIKNEDIDDKEDLLELLKKSIKKLKSAKNFVLDADEVGAQKKLNKAKNSLNSFINELKDEIDDDNDDDERDDDDDDEHDDDDYENSIISIKEILEQAIQNRNILNDQNEIDFDQLNDDDLQLFQIISEQIELQFENLAALVILLDANGVGVQIVTVEDNSLSPTSFDGFLIKPAYAIFSAFAYVVDGKKIIVSVEALISAAWSMYALLLGKSLDLNQKGSIKSELGGLPLNDDELLTLAEYSTDKNFKDAKKFVGNLRKAHTLSKALTPELSKHDLTIFCSPQVDFFEDVETSSVNKWQISGSTQSKWQTIFEPIRKFVDLFIVNNLVDFPEEGTSLDVNLPEAPSPKRVWWFGDFSTITYLGDPKPSIPPQTANNGGTTTIEPTQTGTLTSPEIGPIGECGTLYFQSWWEIETAAPAVGQFDQMTVSVAKKIGPFFPFYKEIGKLNPLRDPFPASVADHPSTPLHGFQVDFPDSFQWRLETFDLSEFEGNKIKIRFTFDTVDNQFNGFRGWLIDDISVESEH